LDDLSIQNSDLIEIVLPATLHRRALTMIYQTGTTVRCGTGGDKVQRVSEGFRMLTSTRIAALALFSLGFVSLAACGGAKTGTAGDGGDINPSDTTTAPVVLSAIRSSDGIVQLSGRTQGDAIVRLSSPEGQSWGVTAGPDGIWSFSLPALSQPRMLALTSEKGEHSAHAEGAVILLPAPGVPAVIARSGFGVNALGATTGRPVIEALDYDLGGGAFVSGLARPGAAVRMSIDEQLAGEAKADLKGRFSVPAVRIPMGAGLHRLRVETADGAAEQAAPVEHAPPLEARIYRATRVEAGWRLDWRTPGGGQQSTLVFDSAQAALAGQTGAGGAK
jgi:hypothetical protein